MQLQTKDSPLDEEESPEATKNLYPAGDKTGFFSLKYGWVLRRICTFDSTLSNTPNTWRDTDWSGLHSGRNYLYQDAPAYCDGGRL